MIAWVWFIGTVVLPAACLIAAVCFIAFSVRHKRSGFIPLSVVLVLFGALTALANPYVNTILLGEAAFERRVALLGKMRGYEGRTAADFVAAFGTPEGSTNGEFWA